MEMNDKTPLREMLELAESELRRVDARQEPLMDVEELGHLVWWALRLCEMKQSGTATRH